MHGAQEDVYVESTLGSVARGWCYRWLCDRRPVGDRAKWVLASPPALNPGSMVRLTFEHGTYSTTTDSLNCTVADLQSKWIRCKAADAIQEEREQRWYSLDRVIQITKQEK
jgi:hypothetical protein